MTAGQPDFAWAMRRMELSPSNMANERLWLSAYWQAKNGTGVNGIGRFYYSTDNFDRYGVLETCRKSISAAYFMYGRT